MFDDFETQITCEEFYEEFYGEEPEEYRNEEA